MEHPSTQDIFSHDTSDRIEAYAGFVHASLSFILAGMLFYTSLKAWVGSFSLMYGPWFKKNKLHTALFVHLGARSKLKKKQTYLRDSLHSTAPWKWIQASL